MDFQLVPHSCSLGQVCTGGIGNKLKVDMAWCLQDTSPLPSNQQRDASLEVEDVRSEPQAAAEPAELQAAEMPVKTASHKMTSR